MPPRPEAHLSRRERQIMDVIYTRGQASVAMARRRQFEGRMLAILDGRRNRHALTRLGLVAVILVSGVVVGLSVTKAAAAEKPPPSATQPATSRAEFSLEGLDEKIAKLHKKGTTAEEVIRVLGEADKYLWGGATFKRDKLPQTYIMQYPAGVQVLIRRDLVVELRSEGAPEKSPGFTYRGLRLGSSLEDVLRVLGQPSETVVGKPIAFQDGVLYKDCQWKGRKGIGYYSRPDQGVRLFLSGSQVRALYLTVGEDAGGFTTVVQIREVKDYDDVRFKDLSSIDLSGRASLPATLWFNQKTVWPKSMPAGVDPKRLLSAAMNPGLGVRSLHRQGLTGKGVNVAIIDQELYQDHPEYAGKIAAYFEAVRWAEPSMHGQAVTSLLVGSRCGTAPDARVYYASTGQGMPDTAYWAKALDWIVEQSAKLPDGNKIRVVSVSSAPSGPGSPSRKNTEMWDAACRRAEKAGILVLDCTSHHGFIGPCYYDANTPEEVSKCRPGFPGSQGFARKDHILVPSSPRTTAEEYTKGKFGYQRTGRGGLSWSIPYCAGILAMGWQARPDLDASQMKNLLFRSAYKTADGAMIINPREFIRQVKSAKAR